MIRRKEVKGLFLLLVSITVFFGLSSAGCKKESAQTGQQGFPSSTTGQTNFTSSATFTNPNDAATKTFGSLSVASDNIITARASQSEMITGRMITGRAITARIITGRIITARSPKFINVIGNDNDDDEDDILNLFGRLKKGRLSKKQSEGSEISCEDVKPKCVEGKVEKADCKKDQSTNRLNFDIKLSDCKEIVDEQKGDYIVSTGYAKGYLEISTKVSQGSGEAKFIFAIEDGDSLAKEFSGNKETKRVRAKASKFKTEITGRFIEGEKDVDFRVVTKISGSYSREDEVGKRKEAYSYSDYVVELTGKSPRSGGEATFYMSITGGYSVDTEPDSCVEGVFNFKTIKPIKSSGQGYCGIESGEIEVNNARMEFSSGKVKVSVEDQQKEYRCEELGGLCKYEPITIAEGVEQKPCPVWFKDKDGDGYTDGTTKVSCEQPAGYVSKAQTGDCDDNDKNINPSTVWFKDKDKDGYTDGTTKVSCEKPSDEYVSSATAGDCDDGDSSMNPGRTEICDNKDNNCNGQRDEGFNVGQSCSVGVGECARTGQFVCNQDGTGTQCNAIPGTPTPEVCDGLDNNCNGIIDDGVLLVFYKDMDGDGYTDGITQVGCTAPSGYVLSATSGDCDDNDPNINPARAEICGDEKDNNCNGQPDEVDVCGSASTFAKTIGGSSDDEAWSIIQSSDGGYAVAGRTLSFGAGGRDIYVVKLDSAGNVMWTKTIGWSGYDKAYSIIRGSDGGYVVVGITDSGAGGDDFYVVKLDSAGNVVWTKTIGGSSDDWATSIIQSSDGGYVVAGWTSSFGAGWGDIYVVKLDAAGNVMWTKTIGGSNDDFARSIIQSSDGGYVVAGETSSFGAGGRDIYVVKLDSAGNIVWTKTIGGSGHDYAWSIIQSSDGGYIVAGGTESFGAGYEDIYVVKLDSAGNVVWTKTIGGSSLDEARSIIQSSDGGYVVAGWTWSFGAGSGDIYVVKLDAGGNVVWTKTIGGSGDDEAGSIIQSSDGGYVVAGWTSSFGAGGYDFYVVKMDANGNVCFSQNITNYSVSSTVPSFSSPSTVAISQSPMVESISPPVSYGGSVSDVCALAPAPTFAKTIGGSNGDYARSITQSSDGGYVVAGYTASFGAGGVDFYVVKLDSSGNVQWTKTIGGSGADIAYSIIQSSDGGYVVAGETYSFGAGDRDFYVVKLDSSGNVQWTKTIGGSDRDVAYSIIQSSDGGYVIAGDTRSFGAGWYDFYVVKLDSLGNVQWTKTIGGSYGDYARSITQSSDGGYVVAGYTASFGAGGVDFYVVKLDSSGNVQWTKTIGGSSDDYAYSIIQSSDGGYVVAGETYSFGAGDRDFYVVKLDSSGNVQWTKTIGGSDWDVAYSIIQSSDGGYVVAGETYSFGAGDRDFYVVKLDSSGNVQWTKTIGGSGWDEAYSIIQSSDGGYVVAGWTPSFGTGGDIYLVKMDANGNVCFSQNITNYSVSSNVGSFSSPSTVAISQSPTVYPVSPTISSGGSASDVCPSSPAPHICSASQDCGFGSAVETNKEDVKSYGCSAGGVLSRFIIPASMLIVYGWLRGKRKKKKGF
jgi:uncharacterized delta-60 repeat protein